MESYKFVMNYYHVWFNFLSSTLHVWSLIQFSLRVTIIKDLIKTCTGGSGCNILRMQHPPGATSSGCSILRRQHSDHSVSLTANFGPLTKQLSTIPKAWRSLFGCLSEKVAKGHPGRCCTPRMLHPENAGAHPICTYEKKERIEIGHSPSLTFKYTHINLRKHRNRSLTVTHVQIYTYRERKP